MASTARPTLAALRAGMRQLWRSPAGRVGLVLVGALVGLALLAPVLQPFEPETARNYAARLEPPSGRHWFGTDSLGRDVLTLVWYGVRTSLLMGPLSVALGLVAGTLLGLIAGYFRGAIKVVVGWLTDILLAFPAILLAITIVTLAGPSLAGAMVAVGVVQVPIFIRLTRSMVLSLREREFVVAARAQGAGSARVLFRHLLPASWGLSWCRPRSRWERRRWKPPAWAFWGWARNRPPRRWARCWPMPSAGATPSRPLGPCCFPALSLPPSCWRSTCWETACATCWIRDRDRSSITASSAFYLL